MMLMIVICNTNRKTIRNAESAPLPALLFITLYFHFLPSAVATPDILSDLLHSQRKFEYRGGNILRGLRVRALGFRSVLPTFGITAIVFVCSPPLYIFILNSLLGRDFGRFLRSITCFFCRLSSSTSSSIIIAKSAARLTEPSVISLQE